MCTSLLIRGAIRADEASSEARRRFQHFPGRAAEDLSGVARRIAQPPLHLRWSFKLCRVGRPPRRQSIGTAPSVAGDTAFVADCRRRAQALDMATATERWSTIPGRRFCHVIAARLNDAFNSATRRLTCNALSAKKGLKLWGSSTAAAWHHYVSQRHRPNGS